MAADSSKRTKITVDAGVWVGEFAHNWNYIGFDEINYTHTPEGEELLDKFMRMQEKPYYIRAHHLFCTGNCHGSYKWGSTNAYVEDDAGNPVYDWKIVDLIFDTILKHKCRPFVELGFMPLDLVEPKHYDLSKDDRNFQGYRSFGWACPPKDYRKWHDLVYNLVRHCLERYGAEEIRGWYWELWNEPDIFYWRGTVEEFNKLYDYTAAAVKAAYPEARIGGPATTNPATIGSEHPLTGRHSGEFLDRFLDHCANGMNACGGGKGVVLDFITFHAKGGGYRFDHKKRRQNPPSIKRILADVRTGREIIRKYPAFVNLECVLSEIDPDGWAAGGVGENVNFNFRNTEYYASFTAAAFDKVNKYARKEKWDLKLLSWAFMFVGERCFEGTRVFSTQGIDKAIMNLFRMYARLGAREVSFASTGAKDTLEYADPNGRGESSEISGCATMSGERSLELLIYNHHDDWDLAGEHELELEVANLPFAGKEMKLEHYRIDGSRSNAYAEWVRQGRPTYPAPGQRRAIKARDGLELLEPPRRIVQHDGKLKLDFSLPVHGISLLIISPD